MRRWFTGSFAGHYVGRPGGAGGAHLAVPGEGYVIDIYRAVIRNMELVADEQDAVEPEAPTDKAMEVLEPATNAPATTPEAAAPGALIAGPTASATNTPPTVHHHLPTGPAMHQPHIAKVHFIDAHGPGRTVRGAAFDVLTSELSFSHPARHDGKVYGRVEGNVSGWYRPPAEAEPPAESTAAPDAPGIVWDSLEVPTAVAVDPIEHELRRQAAAGPNGAPEPSQENAEAEADNADTEVTSRSDDGGQEPPVPSGPDGSPIERASLDSPATAEPPFFAAAIVIAAVLALTAPPLSAAIWLLCFLPPFGLRKWLLGVIPDGPATSLLAYALGFGELLIAASEVAGYYSAGCRSLGVLPLLSTVAALMISSVLPRPVGFGASLLGLAAILFAYYAHLALPYC